MATDTGPVGAARRRWRRSPASPCSGGRGSRRTPSTRAWTPPRPASPAYWVSLFVRQRRRAAAGGGRPGTPGSTSPGAGCRAEPTPAAGAATDLDPLAAHRRGGGRGVLGRQLLRRAGRRLAPGDHAGHRVHAEPRRAVLRRVPADPVRGHRRLPLRPHPAAGTCSVGAALPAAVPAGHRRRAAAALPGGVQRVRAHVLGGRGDLLRAAALAVRGVRVPARRRAGDLVPDAAAGGRAVGAGRGAHRRPERPQPAAAAREVPA